MYPRSYEGRYMSRPTLDEYFMAIAHQVATRSTCLDKQVGCVLVDTSDHIIATGYNGAPSGFPHCVNCTVNQYNNKMLCVSAHAEQNAMLMCDTTKIACCYCTLEPCIVCTRMLMNTSCRRVVFATHTKISGASLWKTINNDWSWSRYD